VWSKTALFINYDENDGFFDHVVPPYPPMSAAQGRSTVAVGPDLYAGDPNRVAGAYGLGQRVPMIVISPWSKGGYVCSETFDHTSVIRFMERRFGVHEPNISPWRRTVCGDLTSAFDFSRSDARLVSLPDTDGYQPPDRDRHDDYIPAVPADPMVPKQERGRRRTRPLAYSPTVDAAASSSGVELTFATGRHAGGAFYVTAAKRNDGPWSYTTEAGKQISESWNGANYDLTVTGPNGFTRGFRGHGTGPEVTARPDASGDLRLILSNAGRRNVRLTLTSAYGGRKRTFTVRPGLSVSYTADLAGSDHWYDLTLTSDHDSDWLRRLAGHIETGRPSLSDPGIITD
jgi:phospholipase C